MKNTYTWYKDLPLALSAEIVACVLGISRSGAYNLMHDPNFPSIRIGRRYIVMRDKFIQWLEEQSQ